MKAKAEPIKEGDPCGPNTLEGLSALCSQRANRTNESQFKIGNVTMTAQGDAASVCLNL
jgi:hypothetical protein